MTHPPTRHPDLPSLTSLPLPSVSFRPATRRVFLSALLALSLVAPWAQATLFDDVNGHEWNGEPWGADAATSITDFQGRRCLQCQVTSLEPATPWAVFRTKRFPLETWQNTYQQLKADVHVVGANPRSRLKLEVHGAKFDAPVLASVAGPDLAPDAWTTVTWDLSAITQQVGAISFVLENIEGKTPTLHVDNLRLVSNGVERPWDPMDGTHTWFYYGQWQDWSGQPPGFPGLEAASSLEGAPSSEAASLYLAWNYSGGSQKRAEIGTRGSGAQTSLGLDLSSASRITFWAKTSSVATPVGVFFYDGTTGFNPPTVFLPSANTWHLVTLDLPWPESFHRSDIREFKLFVDHIDQAPNGTARFDQIEFSPAATSAATSGLRVPLEDFDDRDPTFNRFGGSVGVFAFPPEAPFSHDFVPPGGAATGFAQRLTWGPGYDFVGYYSTLHGKSDYPEFTFDGGRFEFLRFKVRSGSPATTAVNLKVEIKDPAPATGADKFFFTAFRTVGLQLVPGQWQEVTIPLDVTNRASWSHNQYAPRPSALKELVFVVEGAYNDPSGSIDLDDVEWIDADAPEVPLAANASDATFLSAMLRQNLSYFLREAHPTSGLILDRESFSDLASVAATGFGLTAFPLLAREGLTDPNTAFTMAKRALTTLANGPMGTLAGGTPPPTDGQTGVDGFFYRYLDSRTGLRKVTPGANPPDASPVDTALVVWGSLACKGAMTVANGYSAAQESEIAALVNRLVARVNWPEFLVSTGGQPRMLSGWKPEESANYHFPFRGGYASGSEVGPATWDYQTDEVFLIALAGLASPDPAHRLPVSFLSSWQRVAGAFAGHQAVQSYFGSLFTHQFASLWLPLSEMAPDTLGLDLWANNLAAHQANLAFSRHPLLREAFSTFDGISGFLTAHEDPDQRYAGHGAAPNGLTHLALEAPDAARIEAALHPRHGTSDPVNGVLAPYAAGAAFDYLPQEATAILRHYYYDLKIWEPLRGFPDSFTLSVPEFLHQEAEIADETDPNRVEIYERLISLPGRAVQHVQYGIDQGPMVISLANHLREGVVHQWITSQPDIRRALAEAFPTPHDFQKRAPRVATPSTHPANPPSINVATQLPPSATAKPEPTAAAATAPITPAAPSAPSNTTLPMPPTPTKSFALPKDQAP